MKMHLGFVYQQNGWYIRTFCRHERSQGYEHAQSGAALVKARDDIIVFLD